MLGNQQIEKKKILLVTCLLTMLHVQLGVIMCQYLILTSSQIDEDDYNKIVNDLIICPNENNET
jgi:hypothetical protein